MPNEVSLDNVQLLLVEDDKGFAEQLVKSLGKRGYQQITVAKNKLRLPRMPPRPKLF